MKLAVNRRTVLFVAIALTAAALAAGVFYASLKNERERRKIDGNDVLLPTAPYIPGREVDAVRRVEPPQGPKPDPIATIREIERINRMNEELRRNRPVQPLKPASPAPVKPGARPKEDAKKPQ